MNRDLAQGPARAACLLALLSFAACSHAGASAAALPNASQDATALADADSGAAADTKPAGLPCAAGTPAKCSANYKVLQTCDAATLVWVSTVCQIDCSNSPTGAECSAVPDIVTAADAKSAPDVAGVPDNEIPTIAFKNVHAGDTVFGDFAVQVLTSDDVGVVSVSYALNGADAATATDAAFAWTWPTQSSANGKWLLRAIAKDASGKLSNPAEIEVIVDNSGPSAPKGMVLIPSGTFLMGCNPATDKFCTMQQMANVPVTLSPYYIDLNETTVAQYKACVDAGACKPETMDTSLCNWGQADRAQHPLNCISWTSAHAFCKWRGAEFDLPTEAQWEMAARGSCQKHGKAATDPTCAADMWPYPWGSAPPTCSLTVMTTPKDPGSLADYGCGMGSTWPVGSKLAGDSLYGVHDLEGNVAEWNRDWAGQHPTVPVTDPMGPSKGIERIWRFGSFGEVDPQQFFTWAETIGLPEDLNWEVGFRCVKSAP